MKLSAQVFKHESCYSIITFLSNCILEKRFREGIGAHWRDQLKFIKIPQDCNGLHESWLGKMKKNQNLTRCIQSDYWVVNFDVPGPPSWLPCHLLFVEIHYESDLFGVNVYSLA